MPPYLSGHISPCCSAVIVHSVAQLYEFQFPDHTIRLFLLGVWQILFLLQRIHFPLFIFRANSTYPLVSSSELLSSEMFWCPVAAHVPDPQLQVMTLLRALRRLMLLTVTYF